MSSKLLLSFALLVTSLTAAIDRPNDIEMAQSADQFVNSVGVNVHLHYTDTPYKDFPSVERALRELNVHHIRDALIATSWNPFYDRLNELGRIGIKAIFVTSPKETDAVLTTFPSRVPESFEAYEGPNEYDLSRDPDWANTLNTFMERLHDAVKSDPKTSMFPIIGPSLTQPASFFDYANLHNYCGGLNPGTSGWGADMEVSIGT